MDFEEADYFVLKNRRVHRAAAVVFALVIAIAFFASPTRDSVKTAASMIFPLAAIWFADELSDNCEGFGGWLSSRQRALAFRWGGWFCLAAFAFLAGARLAA